MYCRWCGKEIRDEDSNFSFCPFCGRDLSETPDEEKDGDKSLKGLPENTDETDDEKDPEDKSDKKVSENIDSFYKKNESRILRLSWLLPVLALLFAFLGTVPLNIFDIVILIIGLFICLVAVVVLVILVTHLVTQKTRDGMYHAIFGGVITAADIVLLASFLSTCVEFYSCAAGC
ncbi:MAG: hypothetical protein LUD47_00355 [Clostridia bacterium]|nr:hypothetical protein [Clostridia bacterium]